MYRANLIARNLHASSENRRKQERLFEKEILPLGLNKGPPDYESQIIDFQ